MSQAMVIVGANLAGGVAALTLREEGFTGKVILIGAEPHPPYERPPLSKKYLQGEKSLAEITLRPLAYYAEQNIETRLGVRARRVDPQAKVVELENGERIPYDKVLIASGVRNRSLVVPGADLPGIYSLRDVADADVIRKEGVAGRKVVLAGMGFIGSEVAATLRQRDVEVAVVEPLKMPLAHILGEEMGRVFESFHREHGVQMYFDELVTGFEGDNQVRRVITRSGRQLECDFVVVGVGVEPVTEVVAGTGIKLDNGIVVDEYCQTNIEGIYAAGDVARHYHPLVGRHIRVEHYQNAISQGQAAARNMLGKQQPYTEVHWFWSDQYDYNIQYAGFHGEWDQFVVRGSLEQRNFVGFYLRDQRIIAAVAINRPKDLRLTMPLIQAKTPVEVKNLVDESVKLRSLLSQG
ncbi:MAG: FAD-dependent oxidoreductase [Anaerolineales bacterium]|nr:FAD-dependent oxidoreductase [Anaerolineales bacterium]